MENPLQSPKWVHPVLGVFHYGVYGWVAEVEAPAFAAFTYYQNVGYRKTPTTRVELELETEDEVEEPSELAVEMGQLILQQQALLVPKIIASLWNDLAGNEPGTGMWWHGNLAEVNQKLEFHKLAIRQPSDLYTAMQLCKIAVPPVEVLKNKRIVELMFVAGFEEEHSVGVLTDGHDILSVGYEGELDDYRDAVS